MKNDRYSRQAYFLPIGEKGQKELAKKKVFIIGAGALGTYAAETMARAGIGQMTIMDRDYVEWSNLQRQAMYTEEDARNLSPKATAAARHLRAINSEIAVRGIVGELNAVSPPGQLEDADIWIDATDNFETRLVINDLSQKYGIPWIYGGAAGAAGTTFTFIPGETPCLACLIKNMPLLSESCDHAGVIAPIIQWVSAHQTAEALKWLVGDKAALRKTLLYKNLWMNEQASIHVQTFKSEDCPSCGRKRTYPYLHASDSRAKVLCGRDTVHVYPEGSVHPDLQGIKWRLRQKKLPYIDRDEVVQVLWNGRRIVFFSDGRALIHGLDDPEEAKRIYEELAVSPLNN